MAAPLSVIIPTPGSTEAPLQTPRNVRIHAAINAGDYTRVAEELNHSVTDDLDCQDAYKRTLILTAAKNGDPSLVAYLLSRGADPSIQGMNATTPLSWAVYKEATGSFEASSGHSAHPLTSAIRNKHTVVARLLLSCPKTSPYSEEASAIAATALRAVAEAGNVTMVRLILAFGLGPNAADLLRTTVDAFKKSKGKKMNKIVLQTLQADIDAETSSLDVSGGIHDLASRRLFAAMRQLLHHNPDCVDETDDKGYTPLARAAADGHATLVAFLLRYGADPSVITTDGTPLMLAARNNNVEATRLLLSHPKVHYGEGGYLGFADHRGDTVLHAVVRNNNIDLAYLVLLIARYKTSFLTKITNREGLTAEELAKTDEMKELFARFHEEPVLTEVPSEFIASECTMCKLTPASTLHIAYTCDDDCPCVICDECFAVHAVEVIGRREDVVCVECSKPVPMKIIAPHAPRKFIHDLLSIRIACASELCEEDRVDCIACGRVNKRFDVAQYAAEHPNDNAPSRLICEHCQAEQCIVCSTPFPHNPHDVFAHSKCVPSGFEISAVLPPPPVWNALPLETTAVAATPTASIGSLFPDMTMEDNNADEPAEPAVDQSSCNVCTLPFEEDGVTYHCPCGWGICGDCLTHYAESVVGSNEDAVCCMCKYPIDFLTLSKVSEPAILHEIVSVKVARDSTLDATYRAPCVACGRNNDMSEFFSPESNATNSTSITPTRLVCIHCGGGQCAVCNFSYPNSEDDALVHHACTRRFKQIPLFFELQKVIEEKSKRSCPRCNDSGVKDDACCHISCRNGCGTYCYVCGNNSRMLGWDVYSHCTSANRYEVSPAYCPMYVTAMSSCPKFAAYYRKIVASDYAGNQTHLGRAVMAHLNTTRVRYHILAFAEHVGMRNFVDAIDAFKWRDVLDFNYFNNSFPWGSAVPPHYLSFEPSTVMRDFFMEREHWFSDRDPLPRPASDDPANFVLTHHADDDDDDFGWNLFE